MVLNILIFTAFICAFIPIVARSIPHQAPAWRERGIGAPYWLGPAAGGVGLLAGFGACLFADLDNGGALIAVAVTCLGSYLTVATVTDWMSRKIPKDATWMGLPGIAAGIAYGFTQGWPVMSLVAVGFVLATVVVAFVVKGMGAGDVRLMLVFASCMWWAPASAIFLVFLMSHVVALVVKLFWCRGEAGAPYAPAITVALLVVPAVALLPFVQAGGYFAS